MAMRLGVPDDQLCSPGDYDGDLCSQLDALDQFRCGDIGCGLALLYPDEDWDEDLRIDVESYETDRNAFYRDMEVVIEHVEELVPR